jgi:hypothetical protein
MLLLYGGATRTNGRGPGRSIRTASAASEVDSADGRAAARLGPMSVPVGARRAAQMPPGAEGESRLQGDGRHRVVPGLEPPDRPRQPVENQFRRRSC